MGFVCVMNHSLGSAASASTGQLVEINLLRNILLMVNCFHVLRMHSVVGVVEHLLHRRQHRLIDVRGGWKLHHLVILLRADDNVVAIFLTHHSIGLLNDHASIFNGFISSVVRETIVAGVGGAAGRDRGNRAGVNVGIDNLLILLVVMGLLITWNTKFGILVFNHIENGRNNNLFK